MRASLPAGHLRAATASTAASAPFEPSTPMINRTGVSGSSMRPRATRTERSASCNTFWETLPKKNWPSAVWPCDPATIRSAPHSSAFSMITVAGVPAPDSDFTSHPGSIETRRIPPRRANIRYS
ncbi:MAG TPA: hypothetical protein VKS99_04255 [Blastocatellia bacterium]|nr:hypothetical protein [Blastocatellia bacterium]